MAKNFVTRLSQLEQLFVPTLNRGEQLQTLEDWYAMRAPGGILFGVEDETDYDNRYNWYMRLFYPKAWESGKERILRTQRQIAEVMAIFGDEE